MSANVASFTENLANQIHGALEPKYVEAKETLGRISKAKTIMGAAILTTAVALLILGIALCSAGYLGALAAIFISLPLFYIGYNTVALGNNLKTLADNPKMYCEWGGFGDMDKVKIKGLLKKGTFGIDCCIDSAIDNMSARNQN